jgi:hypothetical protein
MDHGLEPGWRASAGAIPDAQIFLPHTIEPPTEHERVRLDLARVALADDTQERHVAGGQQGAAPQLT